MLLLHTIRKVKVLSKNSILTKHIHEIFIQIFFDNFSREIKVVNSYKAQNHNIFTSFSPRKIDIFFGKSKLNFWTENKDFEQCVLWVLLKWVINAEMQLKIAKEK